MDSPRCKAGVCWDCMGRASAATFGRIRAARADCERLGRSAWWMHQKCMEGDDETDYAALMLPPPDAEAALKEEARETQGGAKEAKGAKEAQGAKPAQEAKEAQGSEECPLPEGWRKKVSKTSGKVQGEPLV